MIKNYLNKFSLKNKKAFIIGGSGLLGSEITEALLSASAEVLNLDSDAAKSLNLKKKYTSNKYKYIFFDTGNFKNLDNRIDKLSNKFGCPDIFINCSYPTTKNWKFSSFSKNRLSILRKNIDLHLNSYSWLSFKICEKMKKDKKRGVVIMLSSIYGIVAQNPEIYKTTGMKENMH